jgi:hypothetical protein
MRTPAHGGWTRLSCGAFPAAGLEMLKQHANVDCSYDLTPEQLYEKVAVSDALIVRSATKVRPAASTASKRSRSVQQSEPGTQLVASLRCCR